MNYLKIAKFQYTDQFGTAQQAYLTWGGLVLNRRQSSVVQFNCYSSEAESNRENLKTIFALPIPQENITAMMSKNGYVGVEISNASWELAENTAFIPDYSEIENGKRGMQLRSLNDLNAVIETVEG